MKNSVSFNEYFDRSLNKLKINIISTLKGYGDLYSIVKASSELLFFVSNLSKNNRSELENMFKTATIQVIRDLICNTEGEGKFVPIQLHKDLNLVVRASTLDRSIAYAVYMGDIQLTDWSTVNNFDDFLSYLYTSISEMT